MQARGNVLPYGRTSSLASNARVTRRCRVTAKAVAVPDRFIPKWTDCYAGLKKKGLRTVSPEEAAELLQTGDWVLLDVRRPDQHEEAHPEGALSVPMYRLLDMGKPDFAKMMKAVAYAFNGVKAIDSNNNFTNEAVAAAPGKRFITMCEAGGTMKPTVNFPEGKASRSLQAAFKLMSEAGFSADDVVHLERGLYGWYQAGLPIKGDYTPDIGRTPMAAADGALQSTIQASGYEMKQGDKPLQEANAKKDWFKF